MNFKCYYIISILIVFSFATFAQEQNNSSYGIIEKITEAYAEEYSDELDLTEVVENLERLIESPININNATKIQLEQLHFLTSFQIDKLIDYRDQIGQMYSVYEFLSIEGFTIDLVNNIEPFVIFLSPDVEPKAYLKQELNVRYSQKLEQAAGFISEDDVSPSFNGIEPSLMLKYRAQKGDKLFWGITAENDSGEELFKGSNSYGFDFYSAFLGYHGKGLLKQIYVGDYQVKTGQGLIQWSSYGTRKSAEALSIRQKGQGIRGYTSTDENQFMRGAAATLGFKNWEFTTFYSNHNIDANVVDVDENENPILVSSLQISGLHRTSNEIEDENALNKQNIGGSIKYKIQQLSFGFNGQYQKLNPPLDSTTQLYAIHSYKGDENYNLSTDFLWVQNKYNIFGEFAVSQSGGTALLTGLEAQPANEISFNVLYRNYAKNFHSIHGTSFGEGSNNINEKGLYAGVSVYPISHIKITAYVDSYETMWMKYTSVGPVRGTDYALQTDYSPTRNLNMYLRLKTETNAEKLVSDLPLRTDAEQHIAKVRYQISWKPSDKYNLRLRAEYTQYSKNNITENGIMVFGDFRAQPIEKFASTARLAWFKTDGWDSRVYAYENDVPQYFYVPAFSGTGLRYYLNLKYQIFQSLTLYVKASQTYFFDKESGIGTGDSYYNTNHLTQIKGHIKYRF